jgi:hypothetical protein
LAQAVACLLCKHKAPSLNPNPAKIKKEINTYVNKTPVDLSRYSSGRVLAL